MKINRQRALLIVLGFITLTLGISAVFIGYRLSQSGNVDNQPGQAAGQPCGPGGSCPSGEYCDGSNTCQTKIPNGEGGCCGSNSDCSAWEVCDVSNGACQSGKSCRAAQCSGDGASCTDNWQCCSGSCSGGTCQGGNACTVNGQQCGGDNDCCSGNCDGGSCAEAPSNLACDSDPTICNVGDNEPLCWTHSGSGCWWVNGGCACGNPGGGVSPSDLSATCGNGNWSVTNNGGSAAQVSVTSCRQPSSGTWTLDQYNENTNNGTQCLVGCGSSTVTVNPGETESGGLGVPECGRWQVDVTFGGQTLCAQADCNASGCSTTTTSANCLETCSVDSDCGTGLKCGTVGNDKVCIDNDLTDGDSCFNVSCEDLTVTPTKAAVGETVNVESNWTIPESYVAVSTKLFTDSDYTSAMKNCLDTDTCSADWKVTAFPTSNKHEFTSTFEFKAYDYASNFVCNEDGDIVIGSTVVGKCTNECTASLTPSQTGGEPVYPACTSLAYTKDDASDSTFPIPGNFTGTAENGDSDNLLASYKIVVQNDSGTETLTGTTSGSPETSLTFDEPYTITSDATAVLTVIDANGEEYTDTACEISLTGEGSLPSTGLLDGTIFVATMGILLMFASYLIYKNKVGSEALATTYLGVFTKFENFRDSVRTADIPVLSRSKKKERFEKRSLNEKEKKD